MLYFLIGLVRAWRKARERSRVRRLLATMSERELRDIGLGHAERIYEVSQPFWRDVFPRMMVSLGVV